MIGLEGRIDLIEERLNSIEKNLEILSKGITTNTLVMNIMSDLIIERGISSSEEISRRYNEELQKYLDKQKQINNNLKKQISNNILNYMMLQTPIKE